MTEIRTITVANVTRVAKTLVDERGNEFVYVDESGWKGEGASCVNWVIEDDKRKPMCIVGTIIHRLNPEWLDLIGGCTGSAFSVEALRDVALFTKDAKKFLAMAQRMQDKGHTWHSAVAAATIYVALSD